MKYEYKCTNLDCGFVTQDIRSMSAKFVETLPCGKCSSPAHHIFKGAPAVATGNMGHQTVDVSVGRDAAMRWAAIEQRQAQRDKVRRESGQVGLVRTQEGYAPISTSQREKRTTATQAVLREGFKADFDNSRDAKLLG